MRLVRLQFANSRDLLKFSIYRKYSRKVSNRANSTTHSEKDKVRLQFANSRGLLKFSINREYTLLYNLE